MAMTDEEKAETRAAIERGLAQGDELRRLAAAMGCAGNVDLAEYIQGIEDAVKQIRSDLDDLKDKIQMKAG